MKIKLKRKITYLYRHIFPKDLRIFFRKLIKFFYYKFRFINLKLNLIFTKKYVNLIIGAALTKQKGWFSTNEEWLDIARENHWNRLFNSKKRVKKILAEHVFEHLTLQEMRSALKLIYENMILGGSLRVAVPDGNNPNLEYRKNCGINGIGADAADHKQFITFELFRKEALKVGFEVKLIEGYKKNKQLICEEFDYDLGYVIRSRRNIKNIFSKEGWNFPDANTSLIVDCFKLTN